MGAEQAYIQLSGDDILVTNARDKTSQLEVLRTLPDECRIFWKLAFSKMIHQEQGQTESMLLQPPPTEPSQPVAGVPMQLVGSSFPLPTRDPIQMFAATE